MIDSSIHKPKIHIFKRTLFLYIAFTTLSISVFGIINYTITQSQNNIISVTDADPTNESSLNAQPDWALILVNKQHAIPSDYTISLKKLKNGQSVDERIYPDLQQMMDDCKAAGLSPTIVSSYRTTAQQASMLNEKVEDLVSEGHSKANALELAQTWVALPGTSEHQLGIAVDINSKNDSSNAVYKWLNENSWKYGFIMRYPANKKEITGVNYEPWHYRYVGKAPAKEIFEKNICLEEYLIQFQNDFN